MEAVYGFKDREVLIKLYWGEKKSTGDIAKEFKVTHGAVCYWMKKHDIPRRDRLEASAMAIPRGLTPWNKGKKGVMPEPPNKGKPLEEWMTKKGIEKNKKGRFKKGQKAWNKGKHIQLNTGRTHIKKGQHLSPRTECKKGQHLSPETEFKPGDNAGSKHWDWRGGISKNPYPPEFRRVRKKILERDEHKCILCGVTNQEHNAIFGYSLEVHHVDRNKYNNLCGNLLTLCSYCHKRIENGVVQLNESASGSSIWR